MAFTKSEIRQGIPAYWASINMRAGLVAFSPIIPLIAKDLGLSTIQLAWLTSIPVICFAISSTLTSWIRRFGSLNQIITWALWLLGISLTLRAVHGAFTLYLFQIGVGIGVAILNVMLPIWVKRHGGENSGRLTGVYVSMMSVMTSVALILAAPLAGLTSLGWRLALLPWGVVAIISALWWQRHSRRGEPEPPIEKDSSSIRMFLHNRLAWQIMMVFGLQSMNAYAARAWIPTIMVDKGFTMAQAGTTIAIAGLIGALLAFSVPHIAQRSTDQRLMIWIIAIAGFISFLLVYYGNSWLIVLGAAGSNIVQWLLYPLSLLLIILRSSNQVHAQSLSSMVQSFGYVLGGIAPLATGYFFDLTGTWEVSLWFMACVSLGVGIFGQWAGRIGHVRERDIVIDSVA